MCCCADSGRLFGWCVLVGGISFVLACVGWCSAKVFCVAFRLEQGNCDGFVKGALKVVFGWIFPFLTIRIDDRFQFLFLIEEQIIIKKNYYLAHYCLTI